MASSLLTELSGAPSVTEDEIAGLSVEQLESAGGELQALCSLLQAELDLYTRYLSSQAQDEAQQATHTTAGASGSGTATPSVSSLDVRGLRRGQVMTRGTTKPSDRLSERQKTRLWQRELEIVLANKRKREKMWLQELHKYQVSVMEAEACQKDLQKAQEGLARLAVDCRRLSFDQLYRFMEDQLRGWLKQASQVWVQVALLRADLSKARAKRERRRGGHDPAGQPVSQINFLRQQLEHSEVKTKVDDNRKVLSDLLRQLERERRKAVSLEEENQRRVRRLEELRREVREAEQEVTRLRLTSTRVSERVEKISASTCTKLTALKSLPQQPTQVTDYLHLSDDVRRLRKQVAMWSRRTGGP